MKNFSFLVHFTTIKRLISVSFPSLLYSYHNFFLLQVNFSMIFPGMQTIKVRRLGGFCRSVLEKVFFIKHALCEVHLAPVCHK